MPLPVGPERAEQAKESFRLGQSMDRFIDEKNEVQNAVSFIIDD